MASSGNRQPRFPMRRPCVPASDPDTTMSVVYFSGVGKVLQHPFYVKLHKPICNQDGSLEKSVRTYVSAERESAGRRECTVCLSLPCHQRMTHVIRGGTLATDIHLTLRTRHGRCGDQRVAGGPGKPCGPRVSEGGWGSIACLLAHRCRLLGEGAINALLLRG